MNALAEKNVMIRIVGMIAILFGLLTLKSGGTVLFISPQSGGHYVPFVLWFNFIAGFFYIGAGVGLWLLRPWAAWLAIVILAATLLVYAMLGVYIAKSGIFEQRTVYAMALRSVVWALIALIAYLKLVRR